MGQVILEVDISLTVKTNFPIHFVKVRSQNFVQDLILVIATL